MLCLHGVIIFCLSLTCQHSKSSKAYCLRVRIPFSPEMGSPLLMSPLFADSMSYPSGFPCPAEVQTDFVDHSSPSAWGSPPSVPTAWGHAGLISSPVSAARPAVPWVLPVPLSAWVRVGFRCAGPWFAPLGC